MRSVSIDKHKDFRDGVSVLGLIAGILLLAWTGCDTEAKLRENQGDIESRLLAIEHRMKEPSPLGALLTKRLDALESRVRHPLFARHVDHCPQCRGDKPSEEGGPSPLCVKGFGLLQQDVRNAREEQ